VVASGFAGLSDVLEAAGLSNYAVTSAELPGVRAAVAAYVDGDVDALDTVPVAFTGPPFRREVWTAMRQVGAGEAVSYAMLAAAAGRPQAARAVGSACATNPVAPFVPCHRIVRSDGSLGNYGYGSGTKAAMLAHEGYQGT
jgi:methylated-DNA-[protein]-cysteine S-methyltransferase